MVPYIEEFIYNIMELLYSGEITYTMILLLFSRERKLFRLMKTTMFDMVEKHWFWQR